jgi:hypothetical protein
MSSKIIITSLFTAGTLLVASIFAAQSRLADDGACPDTLGLAIIGEAENVTIKPSNLRLKARIDTGATTSSIGMHSHEFFERDGKKWLNFSVKDPGSDKTVAFEKRVLRTAMIKRHGAEDMARPVVKLSIELANITMEREFTLADRSGFEFPVLIGRNVLGGKYMVDVSRKFSSHSMAEREE